MHVWRVVTVWLLIQIVPLGILYFVYKFFSEQNFFHIEGLWKGVIASGPIAAYVFITWIGFRYFKELFAVFDPKDNFDNILGGWTLEMKSEHGTAAGGQCQIRIENKRLKLSGTFDETAQQTRVWESDIAFVDGNRLLYIYKLETEASYIGYVRLEFKKATALRVEQMVGEWVAVGRQKKRGSIALTRT